MTSTPLLGYKEIGTIDVTPGAYGDHYFTSLSSFKDHIREDVCHLGGDAAIASANGYGMYIKASVMKRVDVQPRPPAPAPVAAPAAAKQESHGCEFDSQCKGDRICVEGKCQAPAASPAAADPAPAAAVPAAVVPAAAASASAPATKLAAPVAKPAAPAVKPPAPAAAVVPPPTTTATKSAR